MKKTIILLIACTLALFMQSCGAIKPSSFVKATDGGSWSSVLVREDLSYDKAFNETLDVIARRFEMDMISKEGGYARTQWSYTWNDKGKYTKYYRTRVVFKFSADRTKIDLKTEAEYGGDPKWQLGWDTRLLQTIKQDVMGTVGRTVL